MTILLDVVLVLAFVSTLLGTIAMRQPWGPEGPIGAWLLVVFPCLFVAILVVTFASKGLMSFLLAGRLFQFAAAAGVVVTLGTTLFAALDRQNGVLSGLFSAIPYLLLAGCAAVIHREHLPDPRFGRLAVALLGSAALAGWGLTGIGIFIAMRSSLENVAQDRREEEERERRFEQEEAAEYAKLGEDAPLAPLLQYTWSRNGQVRQQARARVQGVTELDDRLIELLDKGNESAIGYIASVYEAPPAKLAPAWGRMLERKLKSWDVLQHDEHAGKWEPNLSVYFEGAQKIQRAGGELRPQLRSWLELLQKSKGLGNLAAFVKTLL